MSETSEERIARFKALQEEIAAKLQEKYPQVEFDRSQHGIDIVHYVASGIDGKVYVFKRRQGIHTHVPNLDGHYLTADDARQAISRYLPQAEERFHCALGALRNVERTFEVEVRSIADGDDLHGVEDYLMIDMKIGGFDFSFRIED